MKSLTDYKPYAVMYVDGMNLLSRSYYGMRDLSYKGHKTGMLYGVARLVIEWRNKNPGIEFVFLWEGENSWRKAKHPIYKAQRHESKSPDETKDFFDGIRTVRESLSAMGVSQSHCDTYEADDLAAFYAGIEKRKALYSSGDWDWWALADRGDILYQHSNVLNREEMSAMFMHKYKTNPVPPDKLWLFKALTGDPSDNISGVPRFPKKIASALCNVKGVDEINVVQHLHRMGKDEWAVKVRENQWLLQRNVELVKFSDIPAAKVQRVKADYSVDGFGDILIKSGMEGLYDRLKDGS